MIYTMNVRTSVCMQIMCCVYMCVFVCVCDILHASVEYNPPEIFGVYSSCWKYF